MTEIPFRYPWQAQFYFDSALDRNESVKGLGGAPMVLLSVWNGTSVVLAKADSAGNLRAFDDFTYDHANGTATAVTTSVTIVTPAAGVRRIRVSADVDFWLNTNNVAAGATGTSIRIYAGLPEIVPVTAGVAVKAAAVSGTANVLCTPLVDR